MGGLSEGSEHAGDPGTACSSTWTRWGRRTGWAWAERVRRNGCERGLQAKPASMGSAQIESRLIEARGRRRLPGRRTVARAVNTACASPSDGSSAGDVCASKGTHDSASAALVGSCWSGSLSLPLHVCAQGKGKVAVRWPGMKYRPYLHRLIDFY